MTDLAARASDAPGRGLWIGLALGAPLIGWGIRSAIDDATRVHPAELARWIVGSALVHDLVVLPVALALGLALRRVVPSRAWLPVRWAIAASAVVTAVAWPFVRGYGRTPTVPSLLDRPYGSGLVALLGTIWLAALAWILIGRARASRGHAVPRMVAGVLRRR